MFNTNGYLSPDFHDYNLSKLKSDFVSNFPLSSTRASIFKDLEAFINELKSLNLPQLELWIDGSFVTDKQNPRDVDFTLFLNGSEVNKLSPSELDIITSLMNGKYNHCDSYYVDKEAHNFITLNNYWRGQFGFDRNNLPKGISKIIL